VIDLTWCYKIVFHVVDTCMDDFFSFTHCSSSPPAQPPISIAQTTIFYEYQSPLFSERVINVWSALTANVNVINVR